jgi:hypothetical protein
VILLCGIPSEPPLVRVARELDALELSYVWFNQRSFATISLELEVSGSKIGGELWVEGHSYGLKDFTGAYCRLMDDNLLPELETETLDSPKRNQARALHRALTDWSNLSPCRVVNRPSAQRSNCSKPYQYQLIAGYGFSIPDTLITNDPQLVKEFCDQHPKVIYKSMSGVRSIVRLMEPGDLSRLDDIRWCPVQFQQFIDGTDVRVHTVGDEIFATAISSRATDYRYGHTTGHLNVELFEVALPSDVCERCILLARGLGLDFAGIDLKLTPDGRVFCFEVNPSPAYSYYESCTGQPIARAVAVYLAGP